MRSNRSPSFQNQHTNNHSPAHTKKYYTREQVVLILKATVEQKFVKLSKQIEEKQQIIKHLNERLNRNDHALQHSAKRLSDFVDRQQNRLQEITINTVNQLLNQKLHNYWSSAKNVLENLRQSTFQSTKLFQQKQQQKIDRVLLQTRQHCEDSVDNFKKKNNAYWAKVKEGLGKIHNKLSATEEKITNIGKQLAKYEHQRSLNQKMMKDIETGVKTAKILVELKKSVGNVYKNFEDVLGLEEVVRDQCNNKILNGYDNVKFGQNYYQYTKPAYNPEQMNHYSANYMNENKKSLGEQFITLEYSVEQEQIQRQSLQNNYANLKSQSMRRHSNSIPKNPPLSPNSGLNRPHSSMKKNYRYDKDDTNLIFSKDNAYYPSNQQSQNMMSPLSDKNLLNNSQEGTLKVKKYQKGYQEDQSCDSFNLAINNNTGLGSSTGLFQHTNNSNAASFMNFSLESRKQTIQNIKQRMGQLIEIKNLQRPLKVYLDHINYLKNQEGNYLFDLKGNMFKVSIADFEELQRQYYIKNIIQINNNKNTNSTLKVNKV